MDDRMNELVAFHLAKPYARLVIPESDGTFRGEILEFPGCLATGDTPSETLSALEDTAKDWLEAALAHGQHIPVPIDSNEFSGRLVLRLAKSLHKKAARLAEFEGVSLNQFIATSLAESVGERAKASSTVFVNTTSSSHMALYSVSPNSIGFVNDTVSHAGSRMNTLFTPITFLPLSVGYQPVVDK